MNAEPDDIDEVEEEEFGNETVGVAEGEMVLFDRFEFAELTNSIGVMVNSGQVWVIDRETFALRDIEKLKAVTVARTLSSVKK